MSRLVRLRSASEILGNGVSSQSVGPSGSNFRFPHGSEILVHAALVGGTHFLRQAAHFGKVVIEHTGLAAERFSLGGDAPLGFLEEGSEDLTALAHGRQLNTVPPSRPENPG